MHVRAAGACPSVPDSYTFLKQRSYPWNDYECGSTGTRSLWDLVAACDANEGCRGISITGSTAEGVRVCAQSMVACRG